MSRSTFSHAAGPLRFVLSQKSSAKRGVRHRNRPLAGRRVAATRNTHVRCSMPANVLGTSHIGRTSSPCRPMARENKQVYLYLLTSFTQLPPRTHGALRYPALLRAYWVLARRKIRGGGHMPRVESGVHSELGGPLFISNWPARSAGRGWSLSFPGRNNLQTRCSVDVCGAV